jgi:3-oxoadipate enol-lactonase
MNVHHVATGKPDDPVLLLSHSLGSTLERRDANVIGAQAMAIAGAGLATPRPHLEKIATSVEDGRLLVVPGAAHLANAEQPGVVTALADHLTKESHA